MGCSFLTSNNFFDIRFGSGGSASFSGINFISGGEFHGRGLLVQFSFARGNFFPAGDPHVTRFVVFIFFGNVDLKILISVINLLDLGLGVPLKILT